MLARLNTDTDRIPDSRQPPWVKEVVAREIQFSKYFALDPLLSLELFFVILSAALIILITRSANIGTQQGILPVGNDGLERRVIVVSREVMGEEPDTEAQLGIFLNRGVQDLSLAVFSRQ